MIPENESWTNLLPDSIRERLHGRSQLQKILSNIVWLSLDKVLRLGIGAVLGIWIARYLGPEQFGLLNYAAAFVVLFSPLSSLGLDTIVIRDILREDEERVRVSLGTAFALRLAAGVVAGALAIAAISIVRPDDAMTRALALLSAFALVVQALDVIDYWFQSQIKSKYVVYARNAAFLLTSAARIVLLIVHAPLIAFAWTVLVEIVLGAIGLLIAYRVKRQNLFRWRVDLSRARTLLRDSWPLAFASLAIILYMRIGQVMVGDYLGNAAAGTYSVALRIAEVWFFLPLAISSSVFPAILKAKAEDEQVYQFRLQRFYDIMGAISLSASVIISLCAGPIVSLLFGRQYADAGPVLAVYIWAGIPVFLGVASNQFLLAEGLMKISLYRTLMGGTASVLLNMVFIPRFGVIGAAIASVISYSVSVFSLILFKNMSGNVRMMLRSLNCVRLFRIGYKAVTRPAGT